MPKFENNHVKVSISLKESTLSKLDNVRDLVTRSAYIEDVLEKSLKIRRRP